MDNEKIDSRPMYVSVCDPDKKTKGHQFKFSTSMEKNKLFVKGLAKSVNENDLKEIFGKIGNVTAVRMPTLRDGRPKGMAYIGKKHALKNMTSLLAAFGSNNTPVVQFHEIFAAKIVNKLIFSNSM